MGFLLHNVTALQNQYMDSQNHKIFPIAAIPMRQDYPENMLFRGKDSGFCDRMIQQCQEDTGCLSFQLLICPRTQISLVTIGLALLCAQFLLCQIQKRQSLLYPLKETLRTISIHFYHSIVQDWVPGCYLP